MCRTGNGGPAWRGVRLAAGALLLGGICAAPAVAGAQGVAAAAGSTAGATGSSLGMQSPADALEEAAAARIAAAVCDRQVVLLGELPEHGEARGFGVKARVVERLVKRCGFRAVLFEAGSYDFFGLEQAIAAAPRNARDASAAGAARHDSLDVALARAIGGLWWTDELAGWRRWLAREAQAGRVLLGGIDDQPSATATYARATLPRLVGAAAPAERATECRDAVARYLSWGYTDAQPYDSTERARLDDCARLAAARAPTESSSVARWLPNEVMLGDLASYFARERSAAERRGAGAPDRDLVMARHVAWWSARLPRDARIVVWTATTHAARATGANAVLPLGVPPLGARLAERWGDRLAVIGLTALQGEWSRAGRPMQPLAPLPSHSLEAKALATGAVGDSVGWAYLDAPALRAMGAVPSRLLGRLTTIDWSAAFDGVLVIRVESAPTFAPRR